MTVTGMFPYDVAELLDGPVRAMFAPITTPVPETLDDIFLQEDPYTAATGWVDFGATGGPFTYARNITEAQYKIQQTTLAVRERITETIRTGQVNVAEFRPEIVKMFENALAVEAGTAAAGRGAYSKVPVGNIEDLTQYRMAFVGERGKDQGIVVESGSPTKERGRNWAFVGRRCQLSAENMSLALAQGDLANVNVTYKLFPDPGAPAGEEHGYWMFEDAGTLT